MVKFVCLFFSPLVKISMNYGDVDFLGGSVLNNPLDNADVTASLFARAGKVDTVKEKEDSGSKEEFGNWFRKTARQRTQSQQQNFFFFFETLPCSRIYVNYFLLHLCFNFYLLCLFYYF